MDRWRDRCIIAVAAGMQLIGHDWVSEPDPKRLGRVDDLAGEQHLERASFADQPRQTLCAAVARASGRPSPRVAELRCVDREAKSQAIASRSRRRARSRPPRRSSASVRRSNHERRAVHVSESASGRPRRWFSTSEISPPATKPGRRRRGSRRRPRIRPRRVDRFSELGHDVSLERVELVGAIDGDRRDSVRHDHGERVVGHGDESYFHLRASSGSLLAFYPGRVCPRRGYAGSVRKHRDFPNVDVDGLRDPRPSNARAHRPAARAAGVARSTLKLLRFALCASIQAWGWDARGRRQYRYHERAVERGEWRKYIASGSSRSRCRVPAKPWRPTRSQARASIAWTQDTVAATVLRLISETFCRVGGERYTRENGNLRHHDAA